MKIKIATSQFPVSSEIGSNRQYILMQMQKAVDHGCSVIHFPEGALSGYAGIDFPSFERYNWELLKSSTLAVMQQAKALKLWVLLGSAHRLSINNKPRNSVYIINGDGKIEDRYDKQFCAGDPEGELEDLAHFSSGDHFSIFEIRGVKCSTLICHEYRYPELYRELKKRGVQIVFHSYHAGNMDTERKTFMEGQVGEENHPLNPGKTLPEITMPATMISYAANNYLWISASNTSAKESCWSSFVVRPDGVITGQLTKNEAGILITEIDPDREYYDATKHWRERAMEGVYYSGARIIDNRSEDRRSL
jgi:predicted amidohydrolase